MDLSREIAEAERKAAELKLKQQAYDALPPEHKLADAIHGKTCHWNHADGCGYFYESWERPGWSRNRALDSARKVLAVTDYETAIKVIEAMSS